MTSPILLELPSELRSQRLSLHMPQVGRGGLIAQAINASLPELQACMSFAQKPATPEECELELHCDLRNLASRRVAEKAGFVLEGVLRNDMTRADGSSADGCVFARV
jgi:hypothetical protein